MTGQTGAPGAIGGGGGPGGAFGGSTGVFRLLQSGLGDQAGWLIGFAIVAGLGLLGATRLRRADPRSGWLIAVGGAFAVSAVVFSYASGIFHPYYVSFLAPWTAMLVGAGVGLALSGERLGRILGPLAIVGGAVTELVVLGNLSGSLSWAKPLVIVAAIAGATVLAIRLSPRLRMIALGVTLAALLAAPATWATETLGHATSSTFPAGGSASASMGGFGGPGGGAGGNRFRFGGGGGLGGPPPGGAPRARAHRALRVRPAAACRASSVARRRGPAAESAASAAVGCSAATTPPCRRPSTYAKAHGGGTIGVESQESAASSIISSDANVAGLGGFSGRESTVSASWLAMEVRDGRLRWILADSQGGLARRRARRWPSGQRGRARHRREGRSQGDVHLG